MIVLGTFSALAVLTLFGVAALLVQPGVGARRVEPPQRVEPRTLRDHVETICTAFFPRDHSHPENLDRVADYIAVGLERAGARVERQRYGEDDRYQNVRGFFGPEPRGGRPRIILGAHYDSHGELPGADDNASGVAVLLELARLIGSGPELSSPVELVGFTLEEMPHAMTPMMGSAVHADAVERGGEAIRVMFSLEMLGFYTEAPGSQRYPSPLLSALYPPTGNFVAIVGRWGEFGLVRRIKAAMRGAGELPVESINAPVWVPGVNQSDHINYWARGYPAVMITDTAFLRNRNYHTLHDTPDTLDYERMATVVKQVYAAVLALHE